RIPITKCFGHLRDTIRRHSGALAHLRASPESIAVLEKWIPGSREEARPGMTETTAVSLCLIVSLHHHDMRWLW
ncbi:hypothetical protein, partial [Stenotrophomonas maltophilia]|uniref:hypothetical protein n=1 Tax=Stenotrophomonas maltophilia TaxID=40324 RepID=UPI0019546B4C